MYNNSRVSLDMILEHSSPDSISHLLSESRSKIGDKGYRIFFLLIPTLIWKDTVMTER